jgi:hypothetical protein
MKTAQETFDHICKSIIAQGKQSYDPDAGDCRYRGPNGLKCAAGFCITDEEYLPSMEGHGVHSPNVEYALRDWNLPVILAMQRIHDFPAHDYIEHFKVGAKGVARMYSLTVPDCLL